MTRERKCFSNGYDCCERQTKKTETKKKRTSNDQMHRETFSEKIYQIFYSILIFAFFSQFCVFLFDFL